MCPTGGLAYQVNPSVSRRTGTAYEARAVEFPREFHGAAVSRVPWMEIAKRKRSGVGTAAGPDGAPQAVQVMSSLAATGRFVMWRENGDELLVLDLLEEKELPVQPAAVSAGRSG